MVALEAIRKLRGRALVALLVVCAASCEMTETKRPLGYVKLGKAQELNKEQTVLAEQGLLVRKDARGYSVMSLLCTLDLSHLEFKQSPRGPVLTAENGSQYSLEGDVLAGPAKTPLPYYDIRIDRGEYDGPVDTLYARIGSEKPRDWRFVFPPHP